MNFDAYIQKIDLVIEELTDIKTQLIEAQSEGTALRCSPIRIVVPNPGVCIPDVMMVDLDDIEPFFANWVPATLKRFIEPPVTPGEASDLS